jgi:hypothetical protein
VCWYYAWHLWTSWWVGLAHNRNVKGSAPGRPMFSRSLSQAVPVTGLERAATEPGGATAVQENGPVDRGIVDPATFVIQAMVLPGFLQPHTTG